MEHAHGNMIAKVRTVDLLSPSAERKSGTERNGTVIIASRRQKAKCIIRATQRSYIT